MHPRSKHLYDGRWYLEAHNTGVAANKRSADPSEQLPVLDTEGEPCGSTSPTLVVVSTVSWQPRPLGRLRMSLLVLVWPGTYVRATVLRTSNLCIPFRSSYPTAWSMVQPTTCQNPAIRSTVRSRKSFVSRRRDPILYSVQMENGPLVSLVSVALEANPSQACTHAA